MNPIFNNATSLNFNLTYSSQYAGNTRPTLLKMNDNSWCKINSTQRKLWHNVVLPTTSHKLLKEPLITSVSNQALRLAKFVHNIDTQESIFANKFAMHLTRIYILMSGLLKDKESKLSLKDGGNMVLLQQRTNFTLRSKKSNPTFCSYKDSKK